MASALAIISKAVFEKLAPGAQPGAVLALDQYASTHKSLEVLGEGGALFLVTVRPPDEQLWLVAVLEDPKLGKTAWSAAVNRVAITDVSRLRSKLKFSTGAGIQAKPGALGMSLQTPRVLTTDDMTLLRAACGSKGSKPTAAKTVRSQPTSAKSTKSAMKPAKAMKAPAAKPAEAAKAKQPETTAKAPKAVNAPTAKPAKSAKATAERPAKGSSATIASTSSATPTGSDLAALQAAFAAKDGAAALSTALACWRAERSPALADLIEAISLQISGAPVTSDLEFTKLAIAKNPLDLGRMVPAVAELPVSFLPTAASLLDAYPDDPRIAKAVAEWTLVPITTSTSKYMFWTRMFAVTVRTGDVRAIPIFKKRLAGAARRDNAGTGWEKGDKAIAKVVASLAKLPAVPVPDAKLLAKLTTQIGKLSPITTTAPVVTRVREPAVKLDGPSLAQAATHLKAGRTGQAITAMLERWREVRVPELADLIDRATRLLPTYDLPLATSDEELHATWMAACAADPQHAMPQLLQNVNHGAVKLREMQIAELATLPDDSRLSIRLAQLAMGGAHAEAGSYWKRLFEAIAKMRDVRTCAPLRRDFNDFKSKYFYHHATGRRIVSKFAINPEQSFETWPVELDQDDRKLFAALESLVAAAETKATSRERELIAAIAEDFDDELPRQVYADWLLERGHPRGELILLEGKPQRTEAETARLVELAKVPYIHGTFYDFAESELTSDRGFIRTLKHAFDTSSLTWREVSKYPLLALVETIDLSRYLKFPTAEDFGLVIDRATSLRRIQGVRTQLEAEDGEPIAPLVKGRFKLVGDDLVRV